MNIAEKQKRFFEHLRETQDTVVAVALSKYKPGGSQEDLLCEATYETICGIMTLIDGYADSDIKLDLIDRETGESMRTDIELHDACEDYLRC